MSARTPARTVGLARGAAVAAVAVVALLAPRTAGAADSIYWANAPFSGASTISFANLDGSGGGQLNTAGATVNRPFGVAVNAAAGRIYWGNLSSIAFANLDGSGGGGQLNTTGATVNGPRGMAIDPAAGRIYWANLFANQISFANLDGSGGGDLNTTGATVNGPKGVTIDPAAGRIYWANEGDTIAFANLDGSGGGGQLNTAGATVTGPVGIAIDPATGRLYWANTINATIGFANLDGSGGGGQLSTAGAQASGVFGVAIDPGAGRVYWVNNGAINSADSIAFANLDGSGGGGQLNLTGAAPNFPTYAALLRAPVAAGEPQIAGGGEVGDELSCSQGQWAEDLLGALLYRAPQTILHQWLLDGDDISGATGDTHTPTEPGAYSCRVAATNHAGTTQQTSAPFDVDPASSPPPNEFSFGKLKRNVKKGAARLVVRLPGAGRVTLAGSAKLRGASAGVSGAGKATVPIKPRGKAKRALRKKGKAKLRAEVTFTPTGGEAKTMARAVKLKRKSGG